MKAAILYSAYNAFFSLLWALSFPPPLLEALRSHNMLHYSTRLKFWNNWILVQVLHIMVSFRNPFFKNSVEVVKQKPNFST